jgi:hypothetical protein
MTDATRIAICSAIRIDIKLLVPTTERSSKPASSRSRLNSEHAPVVERNQTKAGLKVSDHECGVVLGACRQCDQAERPPSSRGDAARATRIPGARGDGPQDDRC